MKLLGQILLALLVIAALQGFLAVLAVGVALLFLWGLIVHPETTVPLLLFLLLLEALGRWPLATVGSLIAVAAAFWIASRPKRAAAADEKPVLLPPPPDAPPCRQPPEDV